MKPSFHQSLLQRVLLSTLFVLLPQISNCQDHIQKPQLGNGEHEPHFIEQPYDQKVKNGDRTVLPCKVAGLDRYFVDSGRGHVQWTRGGFGLGTGRQTDWPHFRMIGQNLESKKTFILLS